MGNVRVTALPLQRPRICNSVVYYQIQIFIFLLRMKKQSWKLSLCMPTVRLYAISQLRTVDNCCMLTSPLATCVFCRYSSKVTAKNTTRRNSCLYNRNQESRLFDFQPKMIKREHFDLSRPSKPQQPKHSVQH